jgi:peptide chain release factor 1
MAERLDTRLESKLEGLEGRFEELARQMADPEIVGDREAYTRTTKAYSELGPVVEMFRAYSVTVRELAEAEELLKSADDPDMKEMAAEEAGALAEELEKKKQ